MVEGQNHHRQKYHEMERTKSSLDSHHERGQNNQIIKLSTHLRQLDSQHPLPFRTLIGVALCQITYVPVNRI